ncbi:MAG: protein kinase family protein [Syntrophobacter sp.]
MPRHYIRVVDRLEPWAKKVQPDKVNWQKAIFDDITDGGKLLRIIPVLKDERPAIGIYGETYYCEAGKDRDHTDALFLYRVDSAGIHLPSSVPKVYHADFELTTQGQKVFETFDSVDEIFSFLIEKPQTSLPVSNKVNAALAGILSSSPAELRTLWRPRRKSANGGSEEKFLQTARRLWKLFGLSKYSTVEVRHDGILSGLITPTNAEGLQEDLVRVFSVGLLNSFALGTTQDPQAILNLLFELSVLPIPASARASVWSSMASGLDYTGLCRELSEVAMDLSKLDPDAQGIWEEPILNAIRAVGKQNDEKSLKELAEKAEGEDDCLVFILKWVSDLQFPSAGNDFLQSCESLSSLEVPVILVSDITLESPRTDSGPPDSDAEGLAKEAFELWVLKQRIPELDNLDDLSAEIKFHSEQLSEATLNSKTLDGIQCLLTQLQAFQKNVDGWLRRLPSPQVLKGDIEEARQCFDRSCPALGNEVYYYMQKGTTPKELHEIAGLVRHPTLLAALPDWFFDGQEQQSGDESPAAQSSELRRRQKLVDPVIRDRVRLAVSLTAKYEDTLSELLPNMPPPPPGEKLETHFQVSLERELRTKQELSEIPQVHRPWVAAALKAGQEARRLLQHVNRLEDLKEKVDEAVWKAIVHTISTAGSPGDRENNITQYERAIEFFEKNLGDALSVNFNQLTQWAERNPLPAAASIELAAAGFPLSFEHNWADRSGRKVPLVFYSYQDAARPYGYVKVPIVVTTSYPKDYRLRLEYKIASSLRKAWPSNWKEILPQELMIPSFCWRASGREHVFTFQVEVPIRKPRADGRRIIEREVRTPFQLSITAVEDITGRALSLPRELKWQEMEFSDGRVTLNWPDKIETRYVDEHPIGPQEQVGAILERLKNDNSFAVIAPRRFGKSTLVDYLQERADELGLVIPKPFLCTWLKEGKNRNYEKMWQEFSDHLQEILGAGITLTRGSEFSGLPGPNAFDHARRAARNAGKSAILLLFDEAQLLFPITDGYRLGTNLKDLLERHWSSPIGSEKVSVLVGLIGLPSLNERAGNNLMALLNPVETKGFKESTLNQLILKKTQGQLHTTRESREYLAEKTGNIFLLKHLMKALIGHINEDGRAWVNYDDVEKVTDELKKKLREGAEPTVSGYLRDVLNEAEDINIWKPMPSYPVAVAMAKSYLKGYSKLSDEGRDAAIDSLNRWCLNLEYGANKRLIYTLDRVNEHIKKLEESEILTKDGFKSDVLAAWLEGLSHRFPMDEQDKEALFKGALERIVIPETLERIRTGGQATVYRFTDKQTQYALRKVELRTESDRKRFLTAMDTLNALKKYSYRREEGARYVFDLRDVGLGYTQGDDTPNSMTGIEIYRWIDGISLDQKASQLNSAIVADIGLKLSKALQFLHKHGILHRDVCPQNIILANEEATPILIDFGFARFGCSYAGTPIVSEFSAPEVHTLNPEWTEGSDIYAIGKTLMALILPDDPQVVMLLPLLERCICEVPQDRPTADALVVSFENIVQQLQIAQRQEAAWETVLKHANVDLDEPSKSWFRGILEKFKPRFEAIVLGLHSEQSDRCAEIAAFLDQVLEGQRVFDGQKLKLGIVKNNNDITQDKLNTPAIHFLHKLRLERSHYIQEKEQVFRKLGSLTDTEMRTRTEEGTKLIAELFDLKSLPPIVRELL